MKSKYWKGHGWHKACDEDNPTGRMFTAIVALKNAGPPLDWTGFPNQVPENYSMLHWAPRWVYTKLDNTRAQCSNGQSQPAFSHWHGAVDLYVPNFSHGLSVPERAGTLVHEARHVEGRTHAKGGNDKKWDGKGAWTYNAYWLAWYGFTASNAPKGQKCLAGKEANSIFAVKFNEGSGPNWDYPACHP